MQNTPIQLVTIQFKHEQHNYGVIMEVKIEMTLFLIASFIFL